MHDGRGRRVRWWGGERVVRIVDAVDAALDALVDTANTPEPERLGVAGFRLPLSTGILGVDRVLDGGIRRGEATVVEADLPAQAAALAYTVARRAPHRRMLEVDDPEEATEWLMAGTAGVPRVNLEDALMTDREWRELTRSLDELGGQDLLVASIGSLRNLAESARRELRELLLVHDIGRFGAPVQVLPALAATAAAADVAVLATSAPMGTLPAWSLERITRVAMVPFDLGGSARMVRPDDECLLAAATLRVDCLSGAVDCRPG